MKERLENTRQSVGWFREELGTSSWVGRNDGYYYATYSSWLIDDVRLKIMPVPSYSRKTIQVFLNPANEIVEKLIAKGLGTRNDWRNLPDATHDFFGMCASTVLAHGEANYEIVYFLNEENKPVDFRLMFIPPDSLSFQNQKITQHIPEAIVQQRNLPSSQVQISPNVILTFQLHEYMRNNFSHTMESLAIIGREVFPQFATEITLGQRRGYFDLKKYTESKNMALADAAKLIGWNGRQTVNESTLEYYQLHRLLRFERFITELRDEILATLNEGLQRVGRQVGFSSQIVIEGLPTISDVEKAETQLLEGACKFEDVMQPFHY